jgi:hypothetical protein
MMTKFFDGTVYPYKVKKFTWSSFSVDVYHCPKCGGSYKIISEDGKDKLINFTCICPERNPE